MPENKPKRSESPEFKEYEKKAIKADQELKQWIKAVSCADFASMIAIKQQFVERGIPNWPALMDESKTVQLSRLSEQVGKKETAKIIYVMLLNLNGYFNISRPMREQQIEELSIEITIKLWYWRFQELIAFFDGVQNGTWGKVFERLDAGIIWEQISVYEKERNKHFETRATHHKTTEIKIESQGDKVGRGFSSMVGALISAQETIKPKE